MGDILSDVLVTKPFLRVVIEALLGNKFNDEIVSKLLLIDHNLQSAFISNRDQTAINTLMYEVFLFEVTYLNLDAVQQRQWVAMFLTEIEELQL